MRYFTLPILILLMNVFSTDAAHARRGGVYGTAEKLHFIAETKIPGSDQGMLSVCLMTKKYHILFMGIYQTSKGYVLADNKCDTNSFLSISAEELAEGKALGAIPQSVPDTPKMTLQQYITGYLFWAVALLVLIIILIKARKRKGRLAERTSLMGDASPVAARILDAMCHAALSDGHIDDNEVKVIAGIAKRLTDTEFEQGTIRTMIEKAEKTATESDFKRLAGGLNAEHATLMMRAVLTVVASDGKLEDKEKNFVAGLAKALNISGDTIMSLMQEITAK